MAQLKMIWKRKKPEKVVLPEGFSVVKFKDDSDIKPWLEICKNGLAADDATQEKFYEKITMHEDTSAPRDLFFIDFANEHIATVTAVFHPEKNVGEVHMVSVRTDMRGRGLGNALCLIALNKLYDNGCEYAFLTTDEWRKAAVKSYLTNGFLPVEYDTGMYERWQAVMREYGIDELEMLNEDASTFCTIKA